MNAVLCTLSPARLSQIEEDAEVVEDLVEARLESQIPGLIDIGQTWDALRRMLGGEGTAADALTGKGGRAIGKNLAGYGPARIFDPKAVAKIAAALPKDAAAMVKTEYPKLAGNEVLGGFGTETSGPKDPKYLRERVAQQREREVGMLIEAMDKVVKLYADAAAKQHSMLVALV